MVWMAVAKMQQKESLTMWSICRKSSVRNSCVRRIAEPVAQIQIYNPFY